MKLGDQWIPAQLRYRKKRGGWIIRAVDNDFALIIQPPSLTVAKRLDVWYDLRKLVFVKLEQAEQLTLRCGAGAIRIFKWIDIDELKLQRARALAGGIPGGTPSTWLGHYFHFAMHPPDMVTRVLDVNSTGRVIFGWNSNGYNIGACTVSEFRRDFRHVQTDA